MDGDRTLAEKINDNLTVLRLMERAVHDQDARWGLGIDGEVLPASVTVEGLVDAVDFTAQHAVPQDEWSPEWIGLYLNGSLMRTFNWRCPPYMRMGDTIELRVRLRAAEDTLSV